MKVWPGSKYLISNVSILKRSFAFTENTRNEKNFQFWFCGEQLSIQSTFFASQLFDFKNSCHKHATTGF